MKRLHIEIISPCSHLVDAVVAGLAVGAVKEKSVGVGIVLSGIVIYQRVHYSVACIYVEAALRIVLVHVLDGFKHGTYCYGCAGGILGLVSSVREGEIPIRDVIRRQICKIVVCRRNEGIKRSLVFYVNVS